MASLVRNKFVSAKAPKPAREARALPRTTLASLRQRDSRPECCQPPRDRPADPSRTASRASIAEQLPYRLITVVGYIMLFGLHTRRDYHGPLRLWTLPTGGGWLRAGFCLAGFAFAWWARIHLGRLRSAFVTQKENHRIIPDSVTGPFRICGVGLIISFLGAA